MQSALNAAARLIFNLRRSDHITDALLSLHWLRVSERIDYKIAVLTYGTEFFMAVHSGIWGCSPLSLTFPVAGLCGLLSPIAWLCHLSDCQLSAAELFRLPPPWIWSSLPEHVVRAATLQSFKKHLKTFLLQRSYSLAL